MPARPALLTRPFVLVVLANLLICTAKFLFVHMPGFYAGFGAGEAEIGTILGTLAVASAVAGPLFGRVMDEHGRRVVILAGGALFVTAGFLYLAIDQIDWFVYLVVLVDGLSGGMLYLALFTYGADQVPAERRTEGLALFGASALLPVSIGAELGDRILAVGTYRDLIGTSIALAFAGFLITFALRDAESKGAFEPSRGVLAAAREPRLWPVWAASFGFFFAASALFMFLKTFVMSRGLASVGGFLTYYAVVAVGLRIVAGWVPDKFGPTRVLMPALGFYVVGMLLLANATTTAEVLVAGACCGVGHGYTFPILFALVLERARPREHGSATAVYTGIDNAMHVVAGPTVGVIIEAAGYPVAFSVLAAVIVAGGFGFFALDRPSRVPSRPGAVS